MPDRYIPDYLNSPHLTTKQKEEILSLERQSKESILETVGKYR